MNLKGRIFNRVRSVFSNPVTDIRDALNYPVSISYQDCYNRYRRQDIAKRIIDAPITGSWYERPTFWNRDETSMAEFLVLIKDLKIFDTILKADTLAAIGRYSLLLLGFADGAPLSSPIQYGQKLVSMSAISETSGVIESLDTNITSPRYGLPQTYSITFGDLSSSTQTVHWSKVVHIVQDSLESRVYGFPQLECVYDRLLDLEKLVGGSADMYWKGARPGYVANLQSDQNSLTDAQIATLKDEMDNFSADLKRWFFVEGMKVDALAPQVVSPTPHIEVQLKMISAATCIPLRILVGSERGELASSQDERQWLKFLDNRRKQYCENKILRPLIDRLVLCGALPESIDGYDIEWPPLIVIDEKDKSLISETKTRTMANYVMAPGLLQLLPPNIFLRNIMNFSPSLIEEIEREYNGLIKEEATDWDDEEN